MYTEVTEEVIGLCKENNHMYPKVIGDKGVCTIAPFIFTVAIVVSFSETGYSYLNSKDINSLTKGLDNSDCFTSVESLFSLLIRDIRSDLSKGKMIGFFTSGDKYLLISGKKVSTKNMKKLLDHY